jgi:two-component system cell cycle response regulator
MARKILMIDDDRIQFRLAQAHFENFRGERYDLDWSATYDDGLYKLLTGSYAACLLDFQLGERDGLQLIREAIAQGCRTPIIFLTAEASEHIDIEAMNAGALDYLVKGEINPRIMERALRYSLKLADTLEALRQLATRDQLTGLLNRREFDRILQEETDRSLRFFSHLSLVMLDIDFFKKINDKYGHPAGDAVLKEVARRLEIEVRSVDRVARYGGEEFGVILVQTDPEGAREVAERIRDAVHKAPFEIAGELSIPVTVSAGVATLPMNGQAARVLVSCADKALYAAKNAGRDRVVIAPPL